MILGRLSDPLDTWKYAERFLGVGTRSYSRFAADLDVSPAYHPQRGPDRFDLPTFWVPPEQGEFVDNGLEQPAGAGGLTALYRDGGALLLPVHPDTLALPDLYQRERLLRCRPGPPLTVVPSANARTVFVERVGGQPVPAHFLKLHFPRRMSRFTRRLRRPIVRLQLWVAAELARIGVPLLPEVAGGVFGPDPKQAWGYLVRDARARHAAPAGRFVVPLFALYGGDLHAPGDACLLEQLVVASGEPAARFVTERVVVPMVRLWLSIVTATGCAAEPHGQNTLFTFAKDGSASQVLYRDCAVYVDPAIRARRGLPPGLPEVNVISRDVPLPREQVFSLTYDSFLGHHTLEFVARVAQQRFGVAPQRLHAAARAEFARWPEARTLLPDTVHYYDSQLHPDGQWHLVDTGEAPQWR